MFPYNIYVYIRHWGWSRKTEYLIEFDRDAYCYHLGPFTFNWGSP